MAQDWFDGALVRPELPGLEATLCRVSGWQALSITDSPQTIELRIVNRTPGPLAATAATLRLLFRPGVLTMVEAIVLAPQSQLAWLLGIRLPAPQQAQREVVVELVGLGPLTVAPGEAFAIRLDGVSAAAAGGSRATRVQLDYRGFFPDPATEIGGTEVMHLPVLRRHELSAADPVALRSGSTARSGPFLAGFLDGADLINDGKTPNNLTVRIVNVSGRPVALSGDADLGTRFFLSFQTGAETMRWGLLGARTDHLALTEAQPGWQVDHYTVRRMADGILAPREYLDLQLVIYTSAAIGEAQLILTYENLADFDDGDLVLLARLGPLAASDAMMRLGGTLVVDGGEAGPDTGYSAVTIIGRRNREAVELLGLSTSASDRKWHLNLVEPTGDTPGGLNVVETGKADYRLFLAYGGNVGIGLPTPDQKLTVLGNAVIRGDPASVGNAIDGNQPLTVCGRVNPASSNEKYIELIGLATHEGAQKWAIGMTDLTNTNHSTGLYFRENSQWDATLFLAHRGNVGIGTSLPAAKLHVAGDLQIEGTATFHGLTTVLGDEPAPGKETLWGSALTICGRKNPSAHELIGLATAAEGQKWHLNIKEPIGGNPGGLNVVETGESDFRLFLAYGGNVGIGTYSPSAKLHVAGDLQVDGTLRSTLKSFSIAHPLRPGEQLLHGSLEGPEAGVYYRGEGVLDGGTAVVRLPDYFEALTRPENRTVQLTAKGQEPFLLSYEDVADGRFIVHGSKSDGRFAWEVRAVRADVAPLVVESGPRSPGSSD